MDERGRELSELRDYGHKLLEELRYPAVIRMLQQTITHISSIAEEYSKEADKWHEKYNDCLAQNEKLLEQIEGLKAAGDLQNKELRTVIDEQALKIKGMSIDFAKQIEKLKAAGDLQNKELRTVIDAQAQKIKGMSIDFAKQMEAFRSYRDQEINSHGEKLQALVATQAMLDKMKSEAEDDKHKLEDEIEYFEAEKVKYENKCKEYDEKIKVNQAKLDGYDTLFDYKLDAERRIAAMKKAADDNDREAKEKIEALTKQCNYEKTLREKLEAELDELKKHSCENADASEGRNENSSNCDYEDDSGS